MRATGLIAIMLMASLGEVAVAEGGKEAVTLVGSRIMPLEESLRRQMSGGPLMDKADLDAALAKAEKHPLGSRDNPVRTESPIGQRTYLSRLRCADGHSPYFARLGNLGPGVFASFVDDYVVDCGGSAPGQVHVIMDMYFKGYVEQRAVPGFTIAAP